MLNYDYKTWHEKLRRSCLKNFELLKTADGFSPSIIVLLIVHASLFTLEQEIFWEKNVIFDKSEVQSMRYLHLLL